MSSSSVGLSWTTPFDGGAAITDYLVEYRVSGALTWLTFADGESTGNIWPTVTGLLPDVSYEFRVGATNSVGTTYSETEIVRTSGFTFVSFAPSYVSKGAAVDVVGTSLSLVTEVRIGTVGGAVQVCVG